MWFVRTEYTEAGMEANIIQMSAGPDITSKSSETSIQILLRLYILQLVLYTLINVL